MAELGGKSQYYKDNSTPTVGLTALSDSVLYISDTSPWQDPDSQYPHIKDIISQLPMDHVIVAVGVDEMCMPESLEHSVHFWFYTLGGLKGRRIIKEYTIMLNDNHGHKSVARLPADPNILRFHWFMMLYYFLYPKQCVWDGSKPQFLHLPGKLKKSHRIMCMWEMDRLGMLSDCMYSYQYDATSGQTQEDWDADLYKLIQLYGHAVPTLSEFTQWSKNMDRVLDYKTRWATINQDEFITLPVENKFYSQVCFELVSETWFHEPQHLTEKTFRPIIAGIPFIHVGMFFADELAKHNFSNYTEFTGITEKDYKKYINVNHDTHSGTINIQADEKKVIDISLQAAENFKKFLHSSADARRQVYQVITRNRRVMQTKCEDIIQHIHRKHPINIFDLFSLDF